MKSIKFFYPLIASIFLLNSHTATAVDAVVGAVDQEYLLNQTVWPTPDMLIYDESGNLLYRKLGYNNHKDSVLKALTRTLVEGENLDETIPQEVRTITRNSLVQSHVVGYKDQLREQDLSADEFDHLLKLHKDRVENVVDAGSYSLKEVYDQSTISQKVKEKLQAKDVKTLVVYYAEWCEPCNQVSTVINEFLENNEVEITYIRLERDYTKL